MLPRLTWWYLLVALIVGVVSALLWLRPELRHNPALFPGLYAAVVALIWWRRYLLHGFSSHHTRLTLWNLLVALIVGVGGELLWLRPELQHSPVVFLASSHPFW